MNLRRLEGAAHWRIAMVLWPAIGAGCQSGTGDSGTKSFPSTPLEALPKSGIQRVADQPACLYWLDREDGSVWRCSLDGSRRELVIDCRARASNGRFGGVRLALRGPTAREQGRITLGCVPGGSGFTTVDACPAGTRYEMILGTDGLTYRDVLREAPYTFSTSPSAWKARFIAQPYQVTDHSHVRNAAVEIWKTGLKPARIDFGSERSAILALLDCEAAVLFDSPDVILWTLWDDRKYLLAKAYSAIVWPRDLSKPDRFVPIATMMTREASYDGSSSIQGTLRPIPAGSFGGLRPLGEVFHPKQRKQRAEIGRNRMRGR